MQLIYFSDYLLLPLCFIILYFIVRIRSRKYSDPLLQKYFRNFFLMHFAGSVLHSLVVQYYYGSGDVFGYYPGGEFIKKSVFNSGYSLGVFFMEGNELMQLPSIGDVNDYVQNSLFTSSSLAAMKFSAFFSFFSFSHFLINAVYFGFFSFIGLWKLYLVFNEISGGKIKKPLALALIFTPTIWFWGSGLGKDSISVGLLGILLSALYNILKKRKIFGNLFVSLLSAYLLFSVKAVLLGVVTAGAGAYLVIYIFKKAKNAVVKAITTALFIISSVFFFGLAVDSIQNSLDEAKSMIESNINTYSMESEESGGSFTPPDFDLTPAGVILAVPKTALSTLYRPYIWEAKKIVILFSALESLLMFLALVYVLAKGGIMNFIRTIFNSPALSFCLTFCILLAIIVGLTTFNSGTLVRYRLPLLPFYAFLILAGYKNARERKNKVPLESLSV